MSTIKEVFFNFIQDNCLNFRCDDGGSKEDIRHRVLTISEMFGTISISRKLSPRYSIDDILAILMGEYMLKRLEQETSRE